MALNIRPSSDSSASSSTISSRKPTSTSDLFAQDMKATAAKQARQQARQPAPKPAKPTSTPEPKHTADDSQSKRTSNASNSSSGASNKPKAASSASQATAAAQSGQDGSAPDDAAVASEANAVANGAKGGRAPSRAAPKNTSSQDVAAQNAVDGSTNPSTDGTNQSGLSLIQLLAKSLESDDTDTAATEAAAPAAPDKSSADGADNTANDPNAIALAMFSQALAATLARQPSPTANAAPNSDATTGITSATQSPGGTASMQDLMTVLAHDVAADAKGKSDDGATQFNVDPTKGAASDATSNDTTAIGQNALAHLGVASHFAAQHLRNDTNTADLKSPVGSSAWQDEIGTHLTWMTQKGVETGSLRVSPEHLGPVEVNISVHNGDASVWFAANHPDTRAALEQALPRLREMFANQGMNLADSGVSRQSLSQQESRNQSRSGDSRGVTGVSAVGAADGNSSAAARINLGLVDLYA